MCLPRLAFRSTHPRCASVITTIDFMVVNSERVPLPLNLLANRLRIVSHCEAQRNEAAVVHRDEGDKDVQ